MNIFFAKTFSHKIKNKVLLKDGNMHIKTDIGINGNSKGYSSFLYVLHKLNKKDDVHLQQKE